jgi:hypothetical protein
MKNAELLLGLTAVADVMAAKMHNFDSLGTPKGGIPKFRGMKIGGGKKAHQQNSQK